MSRTRPGGKKQGGTSEPDHTGTVVLGLAIVAALAVLFIVATADWVDKKLADESGSHAAASVRTRDVEPGDDVFIQTWPVGNKGSVKYTAGRVVVLRGGSEVRSIPFAGGAAEPTVTLPADLGPDDKVRVILDVNGADKPRGASGRKDFQERLDLDVSVASSSLPGKALHWSLAAIGWLAAAGLCYLVARSRFGLANLFGGIDVPAEERGDSSFLVFLCILGMLAVLATGHLVFARPILMTTANDSLVLRASLGAFWVVGLIGGVWIGTRRRREAMRWNPARLRAIEGSRSKLPATMSRPVEAAPAEAVTRALVDAGLHVSARGQIELVRGGVVVARIRATGPRWAPEDLKIVVLQRHDVSVIAEALMPIFGALELLPPIGEPVIVEPRSAS